MLGFLILALIGIVHNPGRNTPGLDGVHETQNLTQAVAGAVATTSQFTFTLKGDFKDTASLSVVPGARIHAKSAGSASTKVTGITIDSVTANTIVATVTLDAAPGAGQTTTVACSLNIGGKPGRA